MLTGGVHAAAIRIISQADIASTLTPSQVIACVEEAFIWKAQDKTSTFPLVFHEFEPGSADMDIKSGHLQPAHAYGLKLVSFFANNSNVDLPALHGTILLVDDQTGQPKALLEGTHLTGLRTGAAAALGAKALARPDSKNFLLVGTGHQCPFQVGAMICAFPNLERIRLANPHDTSVLASRASTLREQVQMVTGVKIPESVIIETAEDLGAAVAASDIITTATPSRSPLILNEWVQPGTHLSCVGSDMSGKQELDPALLSRARVFVDDLSQCLDVGEIEIAVKQGVMTADSIIGEIGEALLENTLGRTNDADITVFDSTGIAIQDLAAAHAALQAAEKTDLGCVVPL